MLIVRRFRFHPVQIILVRGKIIHIDGKVVTSSLGLANKGQAPVLMEPIGRGVGGSVKVSGDFKVLCLRVMGSAASSAAVVRHQRCRRFCFRRAVYDLWVERHSKGATASE